MFTFLLINLKGSQTKISLTAGRGSPVCPIVVNPYKIVKNNVSKNQPHLMPYYISMERFIGYPFIGENKFGIILDKLFLAG